MPQEVLVPEGSSTFRQYNYTGVYEKLFELKGGSPCSIQIASLSGNNIKPLECPIIIS